MPKERSPSPSKNPLPWYRTITRTQWNTLFAAQAGYMLDATDVMLYAFALTTLRGVFGFDNAHAGLLASATLVSSAAGGIAFGFLADRIGRTRALMASILIYSLASAGTAAAHTLAELLLWRTIIGIGLGGEWSSGAVLVAETWPTEHRGKAIGLMQSGWALGYILAALVTAAVLPRWGWRWLFAAGALPALMVFFVLRAVPEPEIWRVRAGGAKPADIGAEMGRPRASAWNAASLFRPPLLSTTVRATALTTSVLLGYWGLFTWLPGFLSTPMDRGGAGMSIVQSSWWIIPVQIGAFFGYVSFGFIADRIGRRPAFVMYMLAAAALVPVYGRMAHNQVLLLALGPAVGFFGSGYFSLFGALLAEIYPTAIRGAGQGFTYNAGRALSAFSPLLIGALADRSGLGGALAVTSAFFLAGALLIGLLPETRGRDLLE